MLYRKIPVPILWKDMDLLSKLFWGSVIAFEFLVCRLPGRVLNRLFLFPWTSPPPGDKDAYTSLFSLLSLSIVTAATYAAAINSIPHSRAVATVLYCLVTVFILILSSTIAAAKSKNQEGDTILKNDRTTIWSCFWINIAAVLFTVLFVYFAFDRWFPGQRPSRRDYTATEVACDPPVLAKDVTGAIGLTSFKSLEQLKVADFDKLKAWMAIKDLDGKQNQILLIQQSPPFNDDYNTFQVCMWFNPQKVKFVNALVFLKRSTPEPYSGRTVYRLLDPPEKPDLCYIRLPKDQVNYFPVFEVPNPNKGDSLLMLVLVKANTDETLPTTGKSFDFFLRSNP